MAKKTSAAQKVAKESKSTKGVHTPEPPQVMDPSKEPKITSKARKKGDREEE